VRVLIVTSGSMGDVAPYTGLGARLRDAGHEVTVAAHAPFAGLFAAAGLPFVPLPGDMRQVLPQARGQDGRTSGTGPRALARLLRIARPVIAELGAGITAAAAATRPEAMLLSTVVAPLGYQVAEARGVPWAGAFLQPVEPTGDFGSVLLGGRSIGRLGNRAAAAAAVFASQSLYRRPVLDLRARLGLPRQPIRTLRARQDGGRYPTFHGFSTAVLPRPSDWRPQLRITGYWWPERPAGWRPPGELEAFLAAGPPPVFVGFGSMAPGRGPRLAPAVLAAIRATGVRAVVQAGWAELRVPDGAAVLSVGAVPHDWLFPRMAAVVHHGGAGTTAAGLRAGVPAVAVPVLADQPFWADRLRMLGASPAPIPFSRLDAGRLAAGIRAVTTDSRYAARARAVSARLAAEDGAAPVLAWLADQDRRRPR
jgi:UDP:flavonoid glycosyltransferase YjiC (YdhE family)